MIARRLRRSPARGYTMIEVTMGLAVLAVGASGVIALQRLTIFGVTEGRNLTAASNIAARHIEAARANGAMWNTATDMSTEAPLVQELVAAAGAWVNMTASAAALPLGASDVNGATAQALPAGVDVAYCTHMRAVTIEAEPGGSPLLLRVEARTFWARSGRPVTDECDPAFDPSAFDADFTSPGTGISVGTLTYTVNDYGWVFLSTSLRRNTLP